MIQHRHIGVPIPDFHCIRILPHEVALSGGTENVAESAHIRREVRTTAFEFPSYIQVAALHVVYCPGLQSRSSTPKMEYIHARNGARRNRADQHSPGR